MIKFKKNEMFSFNGGTYVIKTLSYKLLETRAAQRTFDKANYSSFKCYLYCVFCLCYLCYWKS